MQVLSLLLGGGGPQAILRFRQNKHASAGFFGGGSFFSGSALGATAVGMGWSYAWEGTTGGIAIGTGTGMAFDWSDWDELEELCR